jgi:ectoine hydroxylase-related dioxygenase (phytanoyl-CoA dioxygenase family)
MPATQPRLRPLGLDAEAIAAYRRDGYLLVHDVVPRSEIEDFHRGVHALHLERRARRSRQRADPNDTSTPEERDNHLHGLGNDYEPALRLAHDERILALVGSLVGPGIGLHSAKVISKGPRETRHVCHWHQDDAYWWAVSQSECRLSVWIPLLDCGAHNGALRVVPGDFRRELMPHQPRASRERGSCRLSFAPGEERLEGERELTVPAGSVVLFSARTCHASSGNPSDAHRRAFIMTFQEASASDFSGRLRIIRAAN